MKWVSVVTQPRAICGALLLSPQGASRSVPELLSCAPRGSHRAGYLRLPKFSDQLTLMLRG